MRIRVLGGGWYGCHLALAMQRDGHEVELHEIADRLFAGASGGNPARLHLGFHYPRSRLTRVLCQESHRLFMAQYGALTRTVPVNVYAVADGESLIDWGTYRQVLRGEVDFVELERPSELGLANVEGAMLTGERHIVIDEARAWFTEQLGDAVRLNMPPDADPDGWDWTIDCTFCARDAERVDRYEPCVTALLEGPTDRAVTIMDGPFPSVYPWNEQQGLSSLTSARYTPLARCSTYWHARQLLDDCSANDAMRRGVLMLGQMAKFWPAVQELYRVVDARLTIRAQPMSGSDARFVDVVRPLPRTLRVRAGKIDAILHAEQLIREAICSPQPG
jgi:hypothetical protein